MKSRQGSHFLIDFVHDRISISRVQGLGMAIGAAVMDSKRATIVASVIMLFFLLAGGYYIQKTPVWIGWVKYVSPSYYSYKLQLAAQFSPHQTYDCPMGKCLIAEYPAVQNVGLDHLGIATGAMAVMVVGYRLIAYMFLQRMKGVEK
jgi:ATP-binding cassette subfamily G (WHITE) protein 2